MAASIFYCIIYLTEASIFRYYCKKMFVSRLSAWAENAVFALAYGLLFFFSFLQWIRPDTLALLSVNFLLLFCLYDIRPARAAFHAAIATMIMGLCELSVMGVFFRLVRVNFCFSLRKFTVLGADSHILLILSGNLVIWLLYLHVQNKNEVFVQMQHRLQKEKVCASYYRMLLEQKENQSILLHDIKGHLQSIAILNEHKEPDKVTAYIERLLQGFALQDSVQICGNELLNAILCGCRQRCREHGITFQTDVRSGAADFLEEDELTSLFCNLLDNAFAAACGQTNAYIRLNVTLRPGTALAVITLINSCQSDPFTPQSRLISHKPESHRHGFGLKSIRRIVKKYRGHMQIYYCDRDHSFHTVITMQAEIEKFPAE